MPIHPDPQQNQIEAPFLLNGFVESSAMEIDIARMDIPIHAMNLFGRNIDMLDELLMQPSAVRLGASWRQAVVLIEQKQDNIRQVESFVPMESNQLSQGRQRGGTGWQSDHRLLSECGSFPHQSRHNVCCIVGQFVNRPKAERGNVSS
jgi:hypothetical protein